MSMPIGLATNGIPTEIQFVARAYDNQRVFSAALADEQTFEKLRYQLDPHIFTGA